MKAKDLLTFLQSLPAEALEQNVVLECLDNLYLIEDQIAAAEENYYWNCDTGMISETEVKEQVANQEPDYPIAIDDFEIIYPKGTVFIAAKRPEGAKGLEDKMEELTNQYDQSAIGFDQGGIPHLRIETE